MTATELLVMAGAGIATGAVAIDQAMPFGLMELRGHWRAGLVGLVMAGIIALVVALVWRPACRPGTWDCALFDDGKWGETQ